MKELNSVGSAVFNGDGTTLVAAIGSNEDGKSGFYFFDVLTGRLKATIFKGKANDYEGQVSNDHHTLLTFDRRDNLKFWDMTTGRIKSTIRGIKGEIHYVTFSDDGKTIAVTTYDKTIKSYEGTVSLFDVETGTRKGTLVGQGEWASALRFSPDGKVIATVEKTGVKLWDATTGALKQTLNDGKYPLAFSPDGRMLLTAGKGKTALLWEILAK
jgi:WD40 repeat protein